MPNPVIGSWITQGYGPSNVEIYDPDTGGVWREEFNVGIDLSRDNALGLPILAPVSGTVETAGWGGGWGNSVTVRDQYGNLHRFSHMSEIYVSPGDWIGHGRTLGTVGSTGKSTGPHLSWDVKNPQGQYVDPAGILNAGDYDGAESAAAALAGVDAIRSDNRSGGRAYNLSQQQQRGRAAIIKAAMDAGIPENEWWIPLTIAKGESNWDPNAKSHLGAVGLFQIMDLHGMSVEERLDPYTNAMWAMPKIKEAIDQWKHGEGLDGYELVRRIWHQVEVPGHTPDVEQNIANTYNELAAMTDTFNNMDPLVGDLPAGMPFAGDGDMAGFDVGAIAQEMLAPYLEALQKAKTPEERMIATANLTMAAQAATNLAALHKVLNPDASGQVDPFAVVSTPNGPFIIPTGLDSQSKADYANLVNTLTSDQIAWSRKVDILNNFWQQKAVETGIAASQFKSLFDTATLAETMRDNIANLEQRVREWGTKLGIDLATEDRLRVELAGTLGLGIANYNRLHQESVAQLGLDISKTIAAAAPYAIPEGAKYFPGFAPGGDIASVLKSMGVNFTPPTPTPIDFNPLETIKGTLDAFGVPTQLPSPQQLIEETAKVLGIDLAMKSPDQRVAEQLQGLPQYSTNYLGVYDEILSKLGGGQTLPIPSFMDILKGIAVEGPVDMSVGNIPQLPTFGPDSFLPTATAATGGGGTPKTFDQIYPKPEDYETWGDPGQIGGFGGAPPRNIVYGPKENPTPTDDGGGIWDWFTSGQSYPFQNLLADPGGGLADIGGDLANIFSFITNPTGFLIGQGADAALPDPFGSILKAVGNPIGTIANSGAVQSTADRILGSIFSSNNPLAASNITTGAQNLGNKLKFW